MTITDDTQVEILAMNIWMGTFGELIISSQWEQWAKNNSTEAKALRDQAAEMIGAAKGVAARNRAPGARTHHHHGLGWLFS